MIWSDRRPGFTGRLERQGYRVQLGVGNYWENAYHHVGREVLTDAPKEVVIEAMLETAQAGGAPAEYLQMRHAELQNEII